MTHPALAHFIQSNALYNKKTLPTNTIYFCLAMECKSQVLEVKIVLILSIGEQNS